MIRFATILCLAFTALACLPSTSAEARDRERRGPTRYYDQLGQDRGYEWCLRRDRNNSWDCSYYTLQQCQATSRGLIGYCERNPWAINPRG